MKLLIVLIVTIFLFSFSVGVNASSSIIVNTTIDAVNSTRETDYLVYFSYTSSGRTPANRWGYEIAVDKNNMVIETATNVTMEEGGYALSGHGVKRDMLMEVQVGDIVELDLDDRTVVIKRDEILSSYFLSKRSSEQALEYFTQAKLLPFDFEEAAVEDIVDEITTLMAQIETLMENEELNNTQIANLKMHSSRVRTLASDVYYRTVPSLSLETRALWHRPNATVLKESSLIGLQSFLDRVKELGFNTIYVETFWNGYVSYRSETLETHPNLASFTYGDEYGNDYIKAFIGEATKRGLEVHAWVHTFNAGNVNNLSSAIKEDWLVETYQGTTLHPNTYGGAYYLDPSNPEVLEFVETMFLEMMDNYDFKGIQLDYIRYYDNNFNATPIRDSGYGELPESRFKEAYSVSGNVRDLVLTTNGREMWNSWRMNNITNAVKRFSEVLRDAHPDIVISADVVGSIGSARNTYMQDWLTWVRKGYIDLLCPMIYTGSPDMVRDLSTTIYNSLSNLAFLTSGIAPIYYGYSVESNFNQILASQVFGGTATFASQNVIGLTEVENSLRNGVYGKEAMSHFTHPSIAMPKLLSELERFIHTYVTEASVQNMFLEKVGSLQENNFHNPKDYDDAMAELELIGLLRSYIGNEVVEAYLLSHVSQLIHYLDVWTSRDLIRLGYYDPGTSARPDPQSFTYPVEEEPIEEPLPEELPEEDIEKFGCKRSEMLWSSLVALGVLILFRKKKGII